MASGDSSTAGVGEVRLQRRIEPLRDHIRGGGVGDTIDVVVYGACGA